MKNKTIRLTETAVMLSFATVLSILPLLELPYGGSVTVCSALPLLVISYRHGCKWGVFAGVVYGILQMLLGMKNVMYFTTPLSIAAVILLDYVLAFAALGLGGAFRKTLKNQTLALVCGGILALLLRYILHTVAGATVWAGLSIPSQAALAYSLAYNATYMIPETLVSVLGTVLVSRVLDFRNETVGKATKNEGFNWWLVGATAVLIATLIFDVCTVFAQLQNPETGEFIISGLADVAWKNVGAVSLCGTLATIIFWKFGKKKQKNTCQNEKQRV